MATTNGHPSELAQALATLEAALAEADDAWGASDGLHASPQAAQLRDRISYGAFWCRHNPKDLRAKRHMVALRAEYTEMLKDARDQERCVRWEAAFQRFLDAEAAYLALVRNGQE